LLEKLDEIERRDANIAAATAAQLTSIVHFLGLRNINPEAKVDFKDPDIFLPFPGVTGSSGESVEERRLRITERTKHVLHRLVQERRIPIHVYIRLSSPPSPSRPQR
jgi:hypothetical protein